MKLRALLCCIARRVLGHAARTPAAPVNITAPSLPATIRIGQTITASRGRWSGFPLPSYNYAFYLDDVEVQDGPSRTYAVPPDSAIIGQTVKVVVTATNSEGSDSAASSDVAVVGIVPFFQAGPTVIGTMTVGQTVTAAYNPGGNPPPDATFVWRRNGATIDGATDSTYVLTEDDAGFGVSVDVTLTNSAGSVTSSAPARTVSPATPTAPSFSTSPSITGTAKVGETLTCDPGTWTGTEPIDVAFQWRVSTGGGLGDDIEGATDSTLVLDASYEGLSVDCRVVLTNGIGTDVRLASPTSAILPAGGGSGGDGTPIFKAMFTTLTQFDDEGSAALTLTPNGGAAIGTSKYAQGALELDGSAAQNVDGGSTGALALSGPFTIKWYADHDADAPSYPAIICTATSGTISDGFLIEQGARGTFVAAPSTLVLQYNSDPRGTGPHEYQLVRNTDSDVFLYVDGTLVQTSSYGGSMPCSVVHIGGDGYVAVETVKGALGGLEIYDTDLYPT